MDNRLYHCIKESFSISKSVTDLKYCPSVLFVCSAEDFRITEYRSWKTPDDNLVWLLPLLDEKTEAQILCYCPVPQSGPRINLSQLPSVQITLNLNGPHWPHHHDIFLSPTASILKLSSAHLKFYFSFTNSISLKILLAMINMNSNQVVIGYVLSSGRECNLDYRVSFIWGHSLQRALVVNSQQTTLRALRAMTASVLKEEYCLHTTEHITVHPLYHLNLLLYIISLYLGKAPPEFWSVLLLGKFIKEMFTEWTT